jgi:hypothetical protein
LHNADLIAWINRFRAPFVPCARMLSNAVMRTGDAILPVLDCRSVTALQQRGRHCAGRFHSKEIVRAQS